ncbi:MAG: RNA polymerase sigma factor [Vicinamibacteraceae bacterium]
MRSHNESTIHVTDPIAVEPGDPDRQFERLAAQYAQLMVSAIRRVCGSRYGTLVPDVQQEVHLALWKRLQHGNEIHHPASYVYKVALTTALAMVRRLKPEAAPLDEVERPGSGRRPDRPGTLESAERALLVQQVLATLDAGEAAALRAWLAGFNHAEVAELFGWTESVARHRIYRGLERLRARVGEQHGSS